MDEDETKNTQFVKKPYAHFQVNYNMSKTWRKIGAEKGV